MSGDVDPEPGATSRSPRAAFLAGLFASTAAIIIALPPWDEDIACGWWVLGLGLWNLVTLIIAAGWAAAGLFVRRQTQNQSRGGTWMLRGSLGLVAGIPLGWIVLLSTMTECTRSGS